MKNNETGEFELVLGNNQLVVGFLIVALLFGVAFAMGYIVGRNSTPSVKLQAENTAAASVNKDTRPQPASPATATPAPTPPPDQPAAPPADQPAPAAQTPPEPAPQPTTQPARETVPAETPAPAAGVAEAAPGSYWQVIATSNRTSAEGMVAGLKEKGLPVTLSPGPNNLVRVLVGPYADAQSLGRAKTVLETAGFHPVLKRE